MGSVLKDLTVKLCAECILPETFPGIKFDINGICNHCSGKRPDLKELTGKKEQYRNKLDSLIESLSGKAPVYDVIMAYSGGKDSSWALKLLKEMYDLRILTLTFDNAFVSNYAWENIKNVTDNLNIDQQVFRMPWPTAKKLFSLTAREDIFSATTLLRASSTCTACIGIVKSIVLKTALEMSIPLVAYGWSPGQAPIQSAIMKTNANLAKRNQSVLKKAFPPDIAASVDHYFIPDEYFDNYSERFPHNIHPLAFFDYDESQIVRELSAFGWTHPSDTDTNSSNCLLNAFANHCHLERHGFHPYVWEIANMVRNGIMERDEGINKIYAEQDSQQVEYAKEKLGI